MVFLNIHCVILCILFILNNYPQKIASSKYLITYLPQVKNFIVINLNKNNTILRKQILRQPQPWINHIKPVCVKTPVSFQIFYQPVAFIIKLSASGEIFICPLSKVIFINKVITSIVRRVYQNVDFDTISVSPLHPVMAEKGHTFSTFVVSQGSGTRCEGSMNSIIFEAMSRHFKNHLPPRLAAYE